MEKMQKVIVTGGAGYIGSHVVFELVEAGYEPIIIDNFSNSEEAVLERLAKLCGRKITCYKVDCTDENTLRSVFLKESKGNSGLEKGEIAGVIHFAAFKAVGESVENPLKYYRNNIGSTVALLAVMEEFSVEMLVFSSSCTVYGQPAQLPVTENSPIQEAESPYGFTKIACEQLIGDLARTRKPGFKAMTLRYFNPIGNHSSALIGELPIGPPRNLVPVVTQNAAGLRGQMTVFGTDYNTPDGTCIRDYIHVVDLAKAHVRSLEWLKKQDEKTFNKILNVGTGQGATVLEIINTFEKISGKKLGYKLGPRRPGDVEKIWAETTLANQTLNWEAKLSIEDALRDAWNWQQKLTKSFN